MGKDLTETIKRNMDQKSTEELLDIWIENNRDEYSDEAFEAIGQILSSRQVDLPGQKAKEEKENTLAINSCHYCLKELDPQAAKCPYCGEWLPDIQKLRTKIFTLLAFLPLLGFLILWRFIKLEVIMSDTFKPEKILEDPISAILFILSIIIFTTSARYHTELKKRKGRLI